MHPPKCKPSHPILMNPSCKDTLTLNGEMGMLRLRQLSLYIVHPQFASEFMGLRTSSQTWSHLCQFFEPSGHDLYLSMVRQEHSLKQGESTVGDVYT
jgi:hypothetical protein